MKMILVPHNKILPFIGRIKPKKSVNIYGDYIYRYMIGGYTAVLQVWQGGKYYAYIDQYLVKGENDYV